MNEIKLTPEEDALVGKFFTMLETSGKKYNMDKIYEAFKYARELHEGQFRNSGEPYIVHPVAVAEITAALGLDTDSICAAFLHDTIEDCSDKTSLDVIRSKFGDDVALLVEGLTKMADISIVD